MQPGRAPLPGRLSVSNLPKAPLSRQLQRTGGWSGTGGLRA